MKLTSSALLLLFIAMIGCDSSKKESSSDETYSDVQIVGAMKNVMWKGELGSSINLDTIANKKGLYGLGPESYLTGELLLMDGQSFVSRVTSDSTMAVEKTFDVSAPFLVYAHVNEWQEIKLPANIKTIPELEKFIDQKTAGSKRPFAFKLSGSVASAHIHVQNLPAGSKVSSPEEAHRGQTNYALQSEQVNIVGFFSTEHKGVFTHHDSFLHLHLITKDEKMMGHLDQVEMVDMTLHLPKT